MSTIFNTLTYNLAPFSPTNWEMNQKSLLAHLNKEYEKLYPLLRDAAKSNRKLQEKINVFDENIGAVSNAAFDFFGNYPTKARGQLAKEIEWLIETLTWRMQKEEAILFTMYDNLH